MVFYYVISKIYNDDEFKISFTIYSIFFPITLLILLPINIIIDNFFLNLPSYIFLLIGGAFVSLLYYLHNKRYTLKKVAELVTGRKKLEKINVIVVSGILAILSSRLWFLALN